MQLILCKDNANSRHYARPGQEYALRRQEKEAGRGGGAAGLRWGRRGVSARKCAIAAQNGPFHRAAEAVWRARQARFASRGATMAARMVHGGAWGCARLRNKAAFENNTIAKIRDQKKARKNLSGSSPSTAPRHTPCAACSRRMPTRRPTSSRRCPSTCGGAWAASGGAATCARGYIA